MKYRKYSRAEKEAFTAEWQETGTNRTAFARAHGINVQTFMNWTKGSKAEGRKFVQLPLQTESEVLCRIFRSIESI